MAWHEVGTPTGLNYPSVGETTKKSFADKILDNLQYLWENIGTAGGGGGGNLVLNGSFEDPSSPDNADPNSWEKDLYSGGSLTIDVDANAAHGRKSVKFTAASSSGGGYLTTVDYFEVSPGKPLTIDFVTKAQAGSGMPTIQVVVIYFTGAKTTISSDTAFHESDSNPTSWDRRVCVSIPPATARYAKLRLIGCAAGGNTGSAWFDGVEVTTRMPTVYSCYPGLGTDIAPLSTNSTGWVTPTGGSIPIVLPDVSGGWWVRATVKGYVRGGVGYPLYQYAHARILLGDNNSEETIATVDPSNYALRYFHAYAKISGTGYLQIRLSVDHSSSVSQMYVPACGVLIEILGR